MAHAEDDLGQHQDRQIGRHQDGGKGADQRQIGGQQPAEAVMPARPVPQARRTRASRAKHQTEQQNPASMVESPSRLSDAGHHGDQRVDGDVGERIGQPGHAQKDFGPGRRDAGAGSGCGVQRCRRQGRRRADLGCFGRAWDSSQKVRPSWPSMNGQRDVEQASQAELLEHRAADEIGQRRRCRPRPRCKCRPCAARPTRVSPSLTSASSVGQVKHMPTTVGMTTMCPAGGVELAARRPARPS